MAITTVVKCSNCSNHLDYISPNQIISQLYWCNQCLKYTEPTTAKYRNGLQSFYELLNKAADIHDKKSHDYANNSDPLGNYRFAGELSKLFTDPTDAGLIGRLGEKLYRLSNLDKKQSEPMNESLEDTEVDMMVIIGLFVANRMERRKNNANNK